MRAARLRRSGDISAVRKEGRSLRRAAFVARARHTDGLQTRLAVTAPRTVGLPVIRNRARRRVREAFRLALAEGTPAPGLDMLVTVLPEAKAADFRALRSDAASVLREAIR
ncbi:MAG TPA: ribonuclease P protein component [Candidatus Limnocylindria bacterium]|nr:ribonuclease P protein component [Candidatus Limnocylindria bacterium]